MPYRTQWPSGINSGSGTLVQTFTTDSVLADDTTTSYDTLTINSGVTLTLGLRAIVYVKNTLTVNGTIAGSKTGAGPGAGNYGTGHDSNQGGGGVNYYGGGGGGHYAIGGSDGSGGAGGGTGGAAYNNVSSLNTSGTLTTTLQVGSKGGACQTQGTPGNGGGAFKIVANSIVMGAAGIIHADGQNGYSPGVAGYDGNGGSGGGSGGTVWLVSSKLSGSGIIRANGATGGAGTKAQNNGQTGYTGGTGAAGRVRLDIGDMSAFTGTTSSTGYSAGLALINSSSSNTALATYLSTAKGTGTNSALTVADGATTTLTGTAPTFNYTSITLGLYSTLIVPNLTTLKATGTITVGTGSVIRVIAGNAGPAGGGAGVASVYKGSGGGGGGHVTSGTKGGCGRKGNGSGTEEDCNGLPGGGAGTFYDYIGSLTYESAITANMGGSAGGAGGNCDSGFSNTKNYNYATIKSISSTSSVFTVTYEIPASGVQYTVGTTVTISGATKTSYNGSWTVATSSSGTFTVNNTSNYGASGYDGIVSGSTSSASTNSAKGGGYGGGVVKIICNALVVNGRIIADGTSAEYIIGLGGSNDTTAGGGGGGSGGFVWIQCNTLSGTSPIIRANGGDGGSSVPSGSGGSGANGRVKINAYTVTSWTTPNYGVSEITFSSASDSLSSLPQYQFADGTFFWS